MITPAAARTIVATLDPLTVQFLAESYLLNHQKRILRIRKISQIIKENLCENQLIVCDKNRQGVYVLTDNYEEVALAAFMRLNSIYQDIFSDESLNKTADRVLLLLHTMREVNETLDASGDKHGVTVIVNEVARYLHNRTRRLQRGEHPRPAEFLKLLDAVYYESCQVREDVVSASNSPNRAIKTIINLIFAP